MTILPPPHAQVRDFLQFYRWLLPRLNALSDRFPDAVATSWYRDPIRNAAVGGSPRSQHLVAFAVDFAMPAGQMASFTNAANAQGMVGINEGSHVHVQMFPAGVLPDFFFRRI